MKSRQGSARRDPVRRARHAAARGDRVQAEADGRDRRHADPLAHHEALPPLRRRATSCSASATRATSSATTSSTTSCATRDVAVDLGDGRRRARSSRRASEDWRVVLAETGARQPDRLRASSKALPLSSTATRSSPPTATASPTSISTRCSRTTAHRAGWPPSPPCIPRRASASSRSTAGWSSASARSRRSPRAGSTAASSCSTGARSTCVDPSDERAARRQACSRRLAGAWASSPSTSTTASGSRMDTYREMQLLNDMWASGPRALAVWSRTPAHRLERRVLARAARLRHRPHRLQGRLACALAGTQLGATVSRLCAAAADRACVCSTPSASPRDVDSIDRRRPRLRRLLAQAMRAAAARDRVPSRGAGAGAASPCRRRSRPSRPTSWAPSTCSRRCAAPTACAPSCVVTTDKVYENREWAEGYREDDRLGGHEPYGASKACAELVVDAYRHSYFAGERAPCIATARAGNVIGGGDWAEDRLVPDAMRAFGARPAARAAQPRRDAAWQHVLEPLRGYLRLAERAGRCADRVVGRRGTSGRTTRDAGRSPWIADELARLWGDGARWQRADDQAARRTRRGCSTRRLRQGARKLGWRPRWSLERALAATVDWYRAHLGGADMRALTLRPDRRRIEDAELMPLRAPRPTSRAKRRLPVLRRAARAHASSISARRRSSNAYLRASRPAARTEPFYPLHAFVCERCFLVQLEEFAVAGADLQRLRLFLVLFGQLARARRSATPRWRSRASASGPSSRVVEVASNDGYLLQYFVAQRHAGAGHRAGGQRRAARATRKGVPTLVAFFGARDGATSWCAEGRPGRSAGRQQRAGARARPQRFRRRPEDRCSKPTGVLTHRVPASAAADRGRPVRHHLSRAFLLFLAARRRARCSRAHGLGVFDVEELPTHGGSLRHLRAATRARARRRRAARRRCCARRSARPASTARRLSTGSPSGSRRSSASCSRS